MILSIIIFLICFLLLLLFLKIYISIHYSFINQEQKLNVSVTILHIRMFSKSIDLTEATKEESFLDDFDLSYVTKKMESVHSILKKGNRAITAILNKTKLLRLDWETDIGTGEASSTGVISGGVWAIKGSFIGYIIEKIRLRCNPDIQVNPKFEQKYFKTNLDCMVSIRLGQAIHGILKVIRILK